MGNTISIDSTEAKKLIQQNFFDLILDVRTNEEWNEGHYPSAIHIPVDKVEKEFNIKYPNKTIKILIYCRSGMRAGKAEQILKSQGYNNVYALSGTSYSSLY
jgi:phage shock protein E